MADDPKISVFNMGAGGVQLVKSPLDMADHELVRAQNAEPYQNRGQFGLRKRAGLTRVVPTGTVAPSSAGGPILGGFVIDDSLGYPPLATADQIVFGNGYYSTDSGTTWTAYTPSEIFLPPNSIYNLATGYDVLLTPQFPPVWFDGIYLMGGHQSGQVLSVFLSKAATGGAPPHQLVTREATRVVGTGSLDDTYVLPGLYTGAAGGLVTSVVIALSGGGIYLYDPNSGTVTKLPTLAATATGSATYGTRLYVTAGLSLYSIDPATETAWTTAATVSDAGIAALTGLVLFGGTLYAGSYCSGIDPVRVYAFTPTALASTCAVSTSASVSLSGSPGYMFGPFPPLPSDTRINVVYFGTAGAFITLQGSLLNAEVVAGTSWRVLTFDGAHWHNGADTASDNLINTAWAGSSLRQPGPIMSIAGRMQTFLTRFVSGTTQVGGVMRLAVNGPSWGITAFGHNTVPDSAFVLPIGMTF